MAALERRLTQKRLSKQNEIDHEEEGGEEGDSSPNSDQSEATLTAGAETAGVNSSGDSPESPTCRADSLDDGGRESDKDSGTVTDIEPNIGNHVQNHIKGNKLQRSQALPEDASPPPDENLIAARLTKPQNKSPSRGRLEKSGSQSSEAGTSATLSRDSSMDTAYTDNTGIDLEEFIKMTLNRTPKDRQMLLQLEKDLVNFIQEPNHHYFKFAQMSSYNRMLVHRVAAFFGLDHNVDQTGKAVIVNKTSNTRIPDFNFTDHILAGACQNEPVKVLKRRSGFASFDETLGKSDKPLLDNDKRTKSLEERQFTYQQTRARIFQNEACQVIIQGKPDQMEVANASGYNSKEDVRWHDARDRPWSSTDSSGYSTDSSIKSKLGVTKANSLGEVPSAMYSRYSVKGHSLSKADSASSGASSLGSPMTRPPPIPSSPDGMVQVSYAYPSPSGVSTAQQPVYWVASSLDSIPAGSVLINPGTGQPYINPDGSVYHHNPSQPPPGGSIGSPLAAQSPAISLSTYHQHQQQQQPPTLIVQKPQCLQDASGSKDVCQSLASMSLVSQMAPESMCVGEPPPIGTMQPSGTVVYAGSAGQIGVTPQGTTITGQPGGQPQQHTVYMQQTPFYPGIPGQTGQYRYILPSVSYITSPADGQTGVMLSQQPGPQQIPQQNQPQPGSQPLTHQGYLPSNVVTYQPSTGSTGPIPFQHMTPSSPYQPQQVPSGVSVNGNVSGPGACTISYSAIPPETMAGYSIPQQSTGPGSLPQLGHPSNQAPVNFNTSQGTMPPPPPHVTPPQPAHIHAMATGGTDISIYSTSQPSPSQPTQGAVHFAPYPQQTFTAGSYTPVSITSATGQAASGTTFIQNTPVGPTLISSQHAPGSVAVPQVQQAVQIQHQPLQQPAAHSFYTIPVSVGTHPVQGSFTFGVNSFRPTTPPNQGTGAGAATAATAVMGPGIPMNMGQPMAISAAAAASMQAAGDIRTCILSQPLPATIRPQLQPLQITSPRTRQPLNPLNAPKQQRTRKSSAKSNFSITKDSSPSQTTNPVAAGDGHMPKGSHVLEAYDFPMTVTRADADQFLGDLREQGANIKLIAKDAAMTSNQNNLPLCDFTVLAIFSQSSRAQTALQCHGTSLYKLRSTLQLAADIAEQQE